MAIDLTEYNEIVDSLLDKVKEIALVEYTAGRIRDVEYGKYLASAVGSVVAQAGSILQSYSQAKVEFESIDISIASKQKQLDVLNQQLTNMVTELDLKEQTVAKSLAVQDAQIAQMVEEKLYTIKKTDVLEKSRLDNKRINAAKEYQEFLGMLSANVVPSATDISNCRLLMKNIIDETNVSISSASPTITANGSSYNATVSG